MARKRRTLSPPLDPLCDLLDIMLLDASASSVSAETLRAVRNLRHAAEYAVMAAEMLLEGSRAGRIVTPEHALQWASIKLAEAWDGHAVTSPLARSGLPA